MVFYLNEDITMQLTKEVVINLTKKEWNWLEDVMEAASYCDHDEMTPALKMLQENKTFIAEKNLPAFVLKNEING